MNKSELIHSLKLDCNSLDAIAGALNFEDRCGWVGCLLQTKRHIFELLDMIEEEDK